MTDRNIPLEVQSAPEEVVRVMVGRLELLTPEEEAVTAQLEGLDGEQALVRAAEGLLARYGRFAEPLARRVAALTTEPTQKRRAEALLATLVALRLASADGQRPAFAQPWPSWTRSCREEGFGGTLSLLQSPPLVLPKEGQIGARVVLCSVWTGSFL